MRRFLLPVKQPHRIVYVYIPRVVSGGLLLILLIIVLIHECTVIHPFIYHNIMEKLDWCCVSNIRSIANELYLIPNRGKSHSHGYNIILIGLMILCCMHAGMERVHVFFLLL